MLGLIADEDSVKIPEDGFIVDEDSAKILEDNVPELRVKLIERDSVSDLFQKGLKLAYDNRRAIPVSMLLRNHTKSH